MNAEKMRSSVLAYCEELDKEGTRLCMIHKGFTLVQKVGNAWTVTIGSKIFWLDEGFEGWHFLYAALGLAERDAVAVANQRAQKAIQACADYAQSVYVAKDNTIAELQTRNTALVAAGKALVTAVKVGMPITESIIHQLVEFEKALAATNTEKGGGDA